MTQEVTPSQAARDAAANYVRQYNETRRGGFAVDGPDLLVQAFTRFEEQTRTATEREVLTVAANAVEAARKTWFCSGADCTDYDHGRDEGLQFARDAIRALSEQKS